MILIALGANLFHPCLGPPRSTCEAALIELGDREVTVLGHSRWFHTAPVPPSGQPWFVNGVASVDTDLSPAALLDILHTIETKFGRTRRMRNEARIIDMDLLAYNGEISKPDEVPILPHPRMAERAFVLFPIRDLAPGWQHPSLGLSVEALISALPAEDRGPRGPRLLDPEM